MNLKENLTAPLKIRTVPGKALSQLLRGCHLVDIWALAEGRRVYTHYTWNDATRIYIIVFRELLGGRCGTETIVTALSDQFAVLVHMTLNVRWPDVAEAFVERA
jgi:hypothetical protein